MVITIRATSMMLKTVLHKWQDIFLQGIPRLGFIRSKNSFIDWSEGCVGWHDPIDKSRTTVIHAEVWSSTESRIVSRERQVSSKKCLQQKGIKTQRENDSKFIPHDFKANVTHTLTHTEDNGGFIKRSTQTRRYNTKLKLLANNRTSNSFLQIQALEPGQQEAERLKLIIFYPYVTLQRPIMSVSCSVLC